MEASAHTPGVLANCLEKSGTSYAVTLEIEMALGVDTLFPASKNLLELLLIFLPHLESTTPDSFAWLGVLKEIQSSTAAKQWPKAALTGTDRNPLNRRFAQYPLCAYLLQEPRHDTVQQAIGIKLLFLHSLLNRADEKYSLVSHSNNLRIAIRQRTDELQVLKSLPSFTGDFATYYQQLHEEIKELLLKNNDSMLLNTLRILIEMQPAKLIDAPPKPKYPAAPKGGDLGRKTAVNGIVSIETLAGNPGEGEPPEFDLFFTSQSGSGFEDVEHRLLQTSLLDEEAIDLQARTSEYWLRRHYKLVANDWGRLTLIEQKQLAALIKAGMCSENLQQQAVTGLIGTMYVTGLNLEALLQTLTGPEQVLSNNGSYTRSIVLPSGAFTPNSVQLNDLQPLAAKLPLQLPALIASWVSVLCTSEVITLGERLGIQHEDASSLIKSTLTQFRKRTNLQRVRLERIPTALALEVTLMYQDQLITYLLASSSNQAPPKLAYYVAYPAGMLAQKYAEVVNRMLNP